MSFEGIHIARSGVAASQRALDVIGHNIANIGTPGHSRQRVEASSVERSGPSLLVGPGANAAGVTLLGVSRIRDTVLDAGVRSELANSGGADVAVETLAQIERALGPQGSGLDSLVTKFWNSWEELSLDPSSSTGRELVLAATQDLTQGLRRSVHGVAAVMASNGRAASTKVEDQNVLLREVARLNGEIRAQEAMGENPNSLLDQRDIQLDKLASGLGASIHFRSDGTASVSVNGYEVVGGTNAVSLSVVGIPPELQTAAGAAINPGGEMGALVTEGGAVASQVLTDLDVLTVSLRDAVNAQHGLGFDLDGNAGSDIFTGSTAADAGISAGFTIDMLAASASGEKADGNHALAMAALRNDQGVVGTIGDQARSMRGRVGAAVVAAQTRASLNEGVLGELEAARSSVSGVNLDEELTMLLQYQRSFEASARVLTAIDEMLNVLVNRTGLVGR